MGPDGVYCTVSGAACVNTDPVAQPIGAVMQVIGYVRVSTEEQRDSGAGLAAQRAAIEAECRRRGWQLVEVIEDAGYSAKDLKRPGVQIALDTLRKREANALVVAKL